MIKNKKTDVNQRQRSNETFRISESSQVAFHKQETIAPA